MARLSAAEKALSDILLWRHRVLMEPNSIMTGLLDDPDGLSIALFEGPVWEAAHKAMTGKLRWMCADLETQVRVPGADSVPPDWDDGKE